MAQSGAGIDAGGKAKSSDMWNREEESAQEEGAESPSRAGPSPRMSPSPGSSGCGNNVRYSDRFIPSRVAGLNLETAFMLLTERDDGKGNSKDDGTQAYHKLLKSELLGMDGSLGLAAHMADGGDVGRGKRKDGPGNGFESIHTSPTRNLFAFRTDPRTDTHGSPYSVSPLGGDMGRLIGWARGTSPRKIARTPFKVLDAPNLQDDFYLNLVDWSSQNVLAVGLGACVYLWSAHTSKVTKLVDLTPHDSVCSVAWTHWGTYLAVGTNQGEVQVWDTVKNKKLRTLAGHRMRVGTLAWNSHTLATGGRDRSIFLRDVRIPDHFTSRLNGHRSEVCGLKWSHDDQQLASGGNDNQLYIWNAASSLPVMNFGAHTAAVKALAWSPHQHGLLASGGGTADRCIRFWNTTTATALSHVDTGSQVCNLVWSKNVNEIVSTHGYSQHQIVVWRYPGMSKVATLTGHTLRVLNLAISPDGQTIVTGAGDETLRFWNIFPGPKSKQPLHQSQLSPSRTFIR